MLQPRLPHYAYEDWRAAPFPDRVRMVCESWALQGYGTPPAVYLAYALKIALYIGGWLFFAGLSQGTEGSIGSWWLSAEAFQKAVLWGVFFEGLGLASGSGPLTGRYLPPIGGVLYFLRPRTTKVPLVPGAPLIGQPTRSWLDMVVYLAHYGFLLRALLASEVTASMVVPTLVLLPLLGVLDKTAFLAARPDHYLIVLVAFAFADWLLATKIIWVAVWFWAATSKLNRHFPSVVAVMVSNSPWTGFGPLRRWMYRVFPDDLRPSRLARVLAHGGTAFEYTFPLVLVVSDGGTATVIGLAAMLAFHLFITSSIPMGVPIEWNFMMVYGGLVLFGEFADVRAWEVDSPLLLLALVVALVLVPLAGNLWPRRFSFLMAMRYYAGNWAYSVWLFRGDSLDRLDEHLVKTSPTLRTQLRLLYDDAVIDAILPKIIAFRCMHLHGRALQMLVPRAVDDPDEYEWRDGELIAGQVVGWNFGEGHLHNLSVLEAIQQQCSFEAGDVRCIFVESQPLFRDTLAWTIADAATGVIDQGEVRVRDLAALQPYAPPPNT